MREILFRGKRIDNGEWVYGFLYETEKSSSYNAESYILEKERLTINYKCLEGITTHILFVQVTPDTVGQYTGLTDKNDKNGKKIFEWDIIRANHDGTVGVVRFGEYMSPSDPNHTRHIGFYVDWQGKEKDFLRADLGYWVSRSDVEVIGNIHDNPELLEHYGD